MRLTYNVLWIDDNLSRLSGVKGDFEDCNSEIGIETAYHDIDAKLSARETLEQFQERVAKLISDKFSGPDQCYEIILVDLHLGPRVNGSEVFNGAKIIEIIRDSHSLYRPIIFYSSGDPENHQNAIEQLDTATTSADIYGKSVFIVAYDQLSVFLTKIAKEMHEEEHKINHVRGLLMDQVSELDAYIIKIIANPDIWDSVPEDKRKKVVDEFKRGISKSQKDALSLLEAVKDLNYGEIKDYVLNNSKNINTFTKSKMLREMLRYIDDLKDHGSVLSEGINPGDKCIVAIRNAYGHQIAQELKKNHNADQCKMIRTEARRQVNNIKEVAGK